jgi:membrane protease YdiL (CAAX protease family)
MSVPVQRRLSPDTDQLHSSPPGGWRRLFFADDRAIRSGWRALLFIGIYLALSAAFELVPARLLQIETQGPLPPRQVIVQESCDLFAILSATWIMARLERQSVLSFGYRERHLFRRLTGGAFFGIVSLTVLVSVLWRSHLLVFSGLSTTGIVAGGFAVEWAFAALLVGILEESLLRGYLQYTLSRALGFWPAALLLSIAFALWHISNGGESIMGLIVVGVGGLVFCLSLWYTRSLWWAIGFHAGWDWGQSYLYGTPDSGLLAKGHLLNSHPNGLPFWSGGPTGPEGSPLMLPFLSAIAIVMWSWWGRKREAVKNEA